MVLKSGRRSTTTGCQHDADFYMDRVQADAGPGAFVPPVVHSLLFTHWAKQLSPIGMFLVCLRKGMRTSVYRVANFSECATSLGRPHLVDSMGNSGKRDEII